jgi:hypothetical protein
VKTFAVALALLVVPFEPQDAPPSVAEGRRLIQAGDHASAASVLEDVCESQPQNAQAHFLLGFALHAKGDLEEALVVHVRAAAFPSVAGRAAYNAACAAALLERADEAFFWLQKAKSAGANVETARTDADLAGLRDDPRFTAMFPPVLDGDALFAEKPRVLYALVGEAANDQYGWVARPLGDLDRDGIADFGSTAPSHATNGAWSGRVYVHSGRDGKLLFKADGAAGQQLGNSLAPIGDIDGDETPDVLVGAPGSPRGGSVYVFSGRDGRVLLELSAGEPGDSYGTKVCALGDLDGDGREEIAVGAPKSDANGTDSGRVYAYSGADGELLWTIDGEPGDQLGTSADSTRDEEHRLLAVGAMTGGPRRVGRAHAYRVSAEGADPLWTIEPDATSANLGQYFVSIPGDVDADGVPDVYASDWNNAARGPNTGRVFVHSGRTGERVLTLTGTRAGEGFGTSPSVAGDVNGDGHADLIVGAWQNADGAPSGGRCYLHSGADGELLATYTSLQQGDTLGFDAMGLGDVDGDGGTDFLLTSAWSPALGPRTGRVFVIAGPTFEQ